MPEIHIRPTTESDRPWVELLSRDAWGSEVVLEEYRKIKPEIPLTGEDGIPIRDEIELEMKL